MVDTLGLIPAVVVHSAGEHDRDGARRVLGVLGVLAMLKPCGTLPRLALIWADGGYAGRLADWAKAAGGWVLEIVKRCDDLRGFVMLPRRWVVERTFAWLGRYRRLSKDYEESTDNSEAIIRLATINLMVHRLRPG